MSSISKSDLLAAILVAAFMLICIKQHELAQKEEDKNQMLKSYPYNHSKLSDSINLNLPKK